MAEKDSTAAGPELALDRIKITGTATSVAKAGVEKLDDYPNLVYAPSQHVGKGVCTEDVGASVADICQAFAVQPDTEAVARQFGTTAEHVNDALRYAAKVGYVEPDAG